MRIGDLSHYISVRQIPRYELKFVVPNNFCSINTIVKTNRLKLKSIFHERTINNIYFDDPRLKNFYDNIDGISNRAKIRIRWYGDRFKKVVDSKLEVKLKNGSLGKKTSYLIKDAKKNTFFNQISLQDYDIPEWLKQGLKYFKPTLLNSYKRSYYLSYDQNYRVTVDSNLNYYKPFELQKIYRDKNQKNSIMELKFQNNNNNKERLNIDFPFRQTRFSKYINGIILLEPNVSI